MGRDAGSVRTARCHGHIHIDDCEKFGDGMYFVSFKTVGITGTIETFVVLNDDYFNQVVIYTDENGIAQYANWVLDIKPGLNRLKAEADGLDGSPLVFNATGELGHPHSLTIVRGNNQEGYVGTVLADSFVISVKDSN